MRPAVGVARRLHAQHQFGFDRDAGRKRPVERTVAGDGRVIGAHRIAFLGSELRRAQGDVMRIVAHRVDQHAAVHRPEVDMRQIEKRQRLGRAVFDRDGHVEEAGPLADAQARAHDEVMVEGKCVARASRHLDIATGLVPAEDELRVLEGQVGQFAMQRMIVVRSGVAHRRAPAMNEERAIGSEIVARRLRFVEGRQHGEPAAVEFGVPYLLSLEGQEDERADAVRHAERRHPGGIAEGFDAQFPQAGDRLPRLAEVGWMEFDGHRRIGHGYLLLQSMMPKSVKRFSGGVMLYLFELETDSDFRSNRPEIIRL